MNKKVKIVILLVIVIAIIAGGVGTFLYIKNQKAPLFKYSYENHTWEDSKNGYTIYNDGRIEEFDDYATNPDELKKEKISKDELKQLKDLANQIEDNYEDYDIEIAGAGLGSSSDEIYSKRLKKWVTLSKMEDNGTGGGNTTETGEDILNQVGTLYEKYLEDNSEENTEE